MGPQTTEPNSISDKGSEAPPPFLVDAEGNELETAEQGKSYKYRDFSNVTENDEEALGTDAVATPAPNRNMETSIRVQKFPVKLYAILAQKEFNEIVTWMPHGRSWKVLKPNIFESMVMPLFFEYSNYHSFNRLVNAWSFRRVSSGPDRGSYYHELFLRGKPHLQKYMRRLPKTHKKLPMKKQDEPDFYRLDQTNPLPALEDAPIPGALITSSAMSNLVDNNNNNISNMNKGEPHSLANSFTGPLDMSRTVNLRLPGQPQGSQRGLGGLYGMNSLEDFGAGDTFSPQRGLVGDMMPNQALSSQDRGALASGLGGGAVHQQLRANGMQMPMLDTSGISGLAMGAGLDSDFASSLGQQQQMNSLRNNQAMHSMNSQAAMNQRMSQMNKMTGMNTVNVARMGQMNTQMGMNALRNSNGLAPSAFTDMQSPQLSLSMYDGAGMGGAAAGMMGNMSGLGTLDNDLGLGAGMGGMNFMGNLSNNSGQQ